MGRRFEPVWAHKMKNSHSVLVAFLFKIGRNLPTPVRGILIGCYLYFQSQIFRLKEFRKLSDFPKKLDYSKESIRKSVDFDVYAIVSKYQLKIDSVCHVGAHKGQEISSYLKLGINSAILIEPVYENYLILKDIISGIDNYHAINIAAGNCDGTIEMNLASNDYQSSSVLQPHLHLQEAPDVSFDRVIQSRIGKLDNILPNSQFWDLIVIDVQGYELKVLEGATETLEKCNYIFIEVNRAETYKDCAQIDDIDKFLLNHGFKRTLTRWWSSWGDAFYVRGTLLPLEIDKK